MNKKQSLQKLLSFPSIHNMTEVFTLSWDEFNQKCPKVFKELWLDTDFSDVTLATEDNGQLSAHKVILAACSPLFKRLLQKNPNDHPLLYLMGYSYSATSTSAGVTSLKSSCQPLWLLASSLKLKDCLGIWMRGMNMLRKMGII